MGFAYRAMPCCDVFEPLAVTLWDMAKPLVVLRAALSWNPYGQERAKHDPVRPPHGLGLALRIRMGLTQRVDTPFNPAPVVRPPINTMT